MKTFVQVIRCAAIVLVLAYMAHAQASDITGSAALTSTCSNANSTCDTAGVTNFNIGSPFTVQGPQTLEVSAQSYGLAQVSASGTYSGSTLNFEFSDDGGTTWYINTCTRTDTNLQETSEAIAANAFRAWDCGVGAATKFRVRQSAIGSGGPIVKITLTAGLVEPAPTVQLSSAGSTGANPCLNPHSNLQSVSFTTAGTSAVQEVALSGTLKVYVCSMSVVGQSGTTPTFSLVYGTGASCGSGQAVLIPAFATPANSMLAFANPVQLTPAGQAVCYLQTGTTPVTVAAFTYVQQ
jgi:hypothetical protein